MLCDSQKIKELVKELPILNCQLVCQFSQETLWFFTSFLNPGAGGSVSLKLFKFPKLEDITNCKNWPTLFVSSICVSFFLFTSAF
jgi:hypothetical protein